MSDSKTTANHDVIPDWIEARGGHSTQVQGDGGGGILRIGLEPQANRPEGIS